VLLLAFPAAAITWGEPDGDRHPNVGALLIQTATGWRRICSGTLIAEAVFLTAVHCTEASDVLGLPVGVTFDADIDPETVGVLTAAAHGPDFSFSVPGGIAHPLDIAVIVLVRAAAALYPDIRAASLPPGRLLDQLNARNGLRGQAFTVVGYGVQEPQFGGGPTGLPERGGAPGGRVVVPGAVDELAAGLSQVGVRGDAGTCFGDSGGHVPRCRSGRDGHGRVHHLPG
jgi:hypothetical protein